MHDHHRIGADRPFFPDSNLVKLASFFPRKRSLSKFLFEGDVVAEIGCGQGFLTIPIAEIVGPQGRVYAIDSDQKSVDTLCSNTRRNGYEGIIICRKTSGADLEFIPDSSVDFAFAHSFTDCPRTISEIRRILKKGEGQAYLSVPNHFRKVVDQRIARNGVWHELLADFDVLDEGKGILSRWAVVSTRGNDRQINQEHLAMRLGNQVTGRFANRSGHSKLLLFADRSGEESHCFRFFSRSSSANTKR